MERIEKDRRTKFLERVKYAMQANGVNQANIARETGASSASVSEWFTKSSLPEGQKMLLLPRALGVSGHWLLTGEGDMHPPKSNNAKIEAQAVRNELSRLESWIESERTYWGGRKG